MSETANLLGLPRDVTLHGRACKLAETNFEVEGLFELWLEARAIDGVERHKERLGPAEYRAQMDGLRRDVAACVYAYGGEHASRAVFSAPGMRHLAYLRLAKATPGVTEAWVDAASRKDPEGWLRLTDLILADFGVGKGDGKGKGEGAEGNPPAAAGPATA